MKKTIGTIATAGVVILGSAFFSNSVHADTIQEIQSQRSTVQSNLSETEQKIADVMVELEKLNEKIENVNNALAANEEKMKETKNKIEDSKQEVEKTKEEINVLEDKIEKRKEILKDRIVSLQKSGGDISFLEVLFGSKSFGDMISRMSAVTKIAESDEKLMENQKEDKAQLEEKQEAVKKRLSELKDMKVELEGMQETIQAQKQQNEKDKQILKEKEQKLKGMKNNLEDKDRSLASIERQLRNPDSNSSSNSSNGSSSSSSDGGKLTQLSKSSGGSFSSAIQAGYSQIGTPYVIAGKGLGGFDCSGFVSWAFAQAGVSIPSSTSALDSIGKRIPYSSAQPGDLVFFNTYKTNGHVGIYLGNGKFLGSQSSTGVAVASMSNTYWNSHFSGHVRRIR
ncbi:NlpC/P60 family protein [Virgibacillus doumboii]|uniref:C40 family peptidase n=1 Tax=Virgibacillus doumboii TaxID=2697503 RepID=UPI001967E1D5|nr:C40 family peptidase [Virgibacillus doumboii]